MTSKDEKAGSQQMFETELEFFNSHKDEYLKTYPGQFVLVHGQTFLGSFTTEAQAYEAGIKLVGNVPFLIKQVLLVEREASMPAYTLGLLSA